MAEMRIKIGGIYTTASFKNENEREKFFYSLEQTGITTSNYTLIDNKTATVVVPDEKLSLAIGKEGQNARLAARLTGFKIDIKSETKAVEDGTLDEYMNAYYEDEEDEYDEYEDEYGDYDEYAGEEYEYDSLPEETFEEDEPAPED